MGENQTSRLLSYEPMKAILAEMSFETREKMHRKIPSLQTTNSVVPYKYDYVRILPECIWKLNNSTWDHIYREWEDENRVRHHDERDDFDEDGNRRTRYEYSEEEEARLPLRYIRDGTTIRHLQFTGLPDSIKQQNPARFKIHVAELTMGGKESLFIRENNDELFRSIAPFLKTPLKKLTFRLTPATLHLLGHPLVKDCTELSLGKHSNNQPLTVDDLLRHNKMDQTHLTVAFYKWPFPEREPNSGIPFVRDLVQHWINIDKSIGSTFLSPTEEYFFICDVFDELKTTFNATKSRIQELGDDFFAHCYIIPLNQTSEIVAYAIRYDEDYMCHKCGFALKMEVRSIEFTKAPKLSN